MARKPGHDHNFKNLILDYPREALAFFAPDEAEEIDQHTRILPVRQEQLKARLSDRFRELDVPLLVEWPDGRREALLFLLEEETQSQRFSIHRLAHYCLDLADLFSTSRVVPVVIFLSAADSQPRRLTLGGEKHTYLEFHYLRCVLPELQSEHYWHSDNLVARLNLPNMTWSEDQKIEVYARAVKGLLSLESDPEKQLKYVDFIDIYAALDDNERRLYERQYPEDNAAMTSFSERYREEGVQEGMQQGELALLKKLLVRRFGTLDEVTLGRLEQANSTQLEQWAENVLDARTLDEVFTHH